MSWRERLEFVGYFVVGILAWRELWDIGERLFRGLA